MPAISRIFCIAGAVLASAALSACTSSGGDMGASLAMAPGDQLALPDSVSVLPASAQADSGDREIAVAALSGDDNDGSETLASAFARIDAPAENFARPGVVAPRSPELDALIARYAAHYDVPEALVRRVVKRESNFRPAARNGPYWGLMQIRHDTARGMGFRGPASGLLDAETNLKFAVKYLRGAYLVAGGDHDQAVRFYSRGYYYDAKRRGLLEE
ncbi:MAG: lytic transglycosylase domain-containing protein, partial [Pseudaminobacter sp.]|nr:lytic transglycosylase domain-containing protein [Pseudaminobacter sp.]